MTVKQLIEKLQTMNPDAVVLAPAYDHHFREVGAHESKAEVHRKLSGKIYSEPAFYNDPENIDVVVID